VRAVPVFETIVLYLPRLMWTEWSSKDDPPRDLHPEWEAITLTFQLGCRTMQAGSSSTGVYLAGDWACFHPGYSQYECRGAFRLDDQNLDMGWVPAQNVLHHWKIELRRTGQHTITISDGVNVEQGPFVYHWNKQYYALNYVLPIWHGGCDEVIAGKLCVVCNVPRA
jgi:hypothetical protein